MAFPAIKPEVRRHKLPFEMRHQEQPKHQGVKVPQLRPIQPRHGHGVRVEGEMGSVAENALQDRREQQIADTPRLPRRP
jgi:hypothetical protein